MEEIEAKRKTIRIAVCGGFKTRTCEMALLWQITAKDLKVNKNISMPVMDQVPDTPPLSKVGL